MIKNAVIVLSAILLASCASKVGKGDQAMAQLHVLKQWIVEYSAENKGRLPGSLEELAQSLPEEYHDQCFNFIDRTTGQRYPWLYFPPVEDEAGDAASLVVLS